jgi:heat shock protein HtpX
VLSFRIRMRTPPIKVRRRNSLAAWALLACIVILFSYVLTLGIAAACLVLPMLLLLNGLGGIAGILLLVMGLIIAGTIVWSLIPRREEFKPPGVEIDLSRQPRLKALVGEIASSLGQRIPESIYLIAAPNAFVTERGGGLGGGRRRIMGLGLPLFANMSVSEFRAVLAHEFGHFYSGDTRLGPRVYKTRSAMVRTLTNLASDSEVIRFLTRFAVAALLYMIVVGGLAAYWKLFMRITQLVSRQQEFRSDELACHIAGPTAMGGGLQRISMIGAVSQSFWASTINPVVSAGYFPPLADGLRRYYNAPAIQAVASNSLVKALENSKTSAYDTHPPLKLRLEHIAKIKVESGEVEDRSPAIGLLDDVGVLEKELLAIIAPSVKAADLKPMDWDSAASTVWIPIWKKFVAENRCLLASQTIDSIAALLKDLPRIGGQIPDPPGTLLTREQRTERAYTLIWMAFAIKLIEHGWTPHVLPGEFFFTHGRVRLIPSESVQRLRTGKIRTAAWQNWCGANGLLAVPLTPAPSEAHV